jgi:hypothetical protein
MSRQGRAEVATEALQAVTHSGPSWDSPSEPDGFNCKLLADLTAGSSNEPRAKDHGVHPTTGERHV